MSEWTGWSGWAKGPWGKLCRGNAAVNGGDGSPILPTSPALKFWHAESQHGGIGVSLESLHC